MTKEAMIKVLRYKAEHIKAKIRPEFFAEVADMLEKEPCEDAISRADAVRVASGYCHPANIAKELAKLPPVTPKPKIGHWELVQRGKSIDVCCSNCKAVRIKRYAYGYTIDQLDKEYVKERFESDDMRYCPHCGNEIEVTE